jgi:hypothetical protein
MAGRPKKSIVTLIAQMNHRNAKMISRNKAQRARPFLFTKIPRTASESMHGVLSEHVLDYVRINQPNHARSFYLQNPSSRASVCHNHTPVEALVKHGCLPRDELTRRFSFTFIRNPWTRLLSIWNLLSAWEANGKKTLVHGCRTLDEFVFMLKNSQYVRTQPCSLKFYLTSHQWSWVSPEFTFVGRYERVQKDWSIVNAAVGIKVPLNRHSKLYNKTAQMAKPAEQQYSQEAADIVASLYAEDCFLGGYDSVSSPCRISSDEILQRSKAIWSKKAIASPARLKP